MSHKLLLTLTDYLYLNRFKGTPEYSKFVGTAPEVDQLDRKWVILNRKKKKDLWPNLNSYEYGLIVFIRFVIQLIKVKTNEQFIVSSIIFRTVPFHKNMFLARVRVRVLRRKLSKIIPRHLFLHCTIFWSWNFYFLILLNDLNNFTRDPRTIWSCRPF